MGAEKARRIRKSLTVVSVVAALAGVALVAYPFATDLWAARLQSGLVNDLSANERDYRLKRVGVGDPLTRLEIPKLGVDVVVVEGTTLSALRAGAGHYPRTPLPGEPGNVAIAGHRTTYGAPFARLDELAPGDEIVLTTPIGRHVYEVARMPWVVDDQDWSVIKEYPREGSFLTLTTCHPEGSDDYRLTVRAELVSKGGLAR